MHLLTPANNAPESTEVFQRPSQRRDTRRISPSTTRVPAGSNGEVRLLSAASFKQTKTASREAAAELGWVVVETSDSGFVCEEPFSFWRSLPARMRVTVSTEGNHTIVSISGSTVGSETSRHCRKRVARFADLLRTLL